MKIPPKVRKNFWGDFHKVRLITYKYFAVLFARRYSVSPSGASSIFAEYARCKIRHCDLSAGRRKKRLSTASQMNTHAAISKTVFIYALSNT